MSFRWVLALVAALAAVALAGAARRDGTPPPAVGTDVALCGTVEEVWMRETEPGWEGLHLRLRTDSDVIEVRVGPLSYVAEQGMWIEPGDRIDVTGAVTIDGGVRVLVARRLEVGGAAVELRDTLGRPLWSGRGRRAGARSVVPYLATELVIPEGDPVNGRHAFRQLGCASCHRVGGDLAMPAPVVDRPGPVLGANVGQWSAEGIAAAILTPSHYVDPMHESAEGGLSRMGDFSEAMTLRQWVDLVSYIRSQARPDAWASRAAR